MFAKPRGRYQPFGANSRVSYNVGNLHSLRRETAAAGSSFLAVVTTTFKTFMSLLGVGSNWFFCLSLGTTLEDTTKRYSKVSVVAGGFNDGTFGFLIILHLTINITSCNGLN